MTDRKTVSGVEVFIGIGPNGEAYVPFVVNGFGVAFPLESLPELIATLQEMVAEGPAVVEQIRQAEAMGNAQGSA